jgi:hypothetical protein
MALPNIFTAPVSLDIIHRINKLTSSTLAQWGKMNVSQMLAHCCVTYEMIFEDKHAKPNFLVRFMLKAFVKGKVVGEAPYTQGGPTAPQFVITDERDFEKEKARLINYINRAQQMGEAAFEGKESHSFGVLNKTEWNNMMYKHLNHHLNQFGV